MNIRQAALLILVALAAVAACSLRQPTPGSPVPAAAGPDSTSVAISTSTPALTPTPEPAPVKPEPTAVVERPAPAVRSIILLIGDGMGFAHLDAARLWKYGADGKLALDELPVRGELTTHSADASITDSAAAATAMATGHKTNNGFVSVAADETTVLETILEQAQTLGKATGIVVTSKVTDATPAAFYAHVDERNPQNLIAAEALEAGLDVLMGGGASHFIPQDAAIADAAECLSRRKDSRDLMAQAKAEGYSVATRGAALLAADAVPLLGLFACDGMSFDLERRSDEPSLAEMTMKALALLSKDADGFFLMVEGSAIDHASHKNDGLNAIGDTIAFDEAVRVALEYAQSNQHTLVIVTADHETGGLRVILPDGSGKLASRASDQTIPIAGRPESAMALRWSGDDHTDQKVLLATYGPESQLAARAFDNTDIYRIMASALAIETVPVVLSTPVPTPTQTPPFEQTCAAEVEPIARSGEVTRSDDDGVLKIGLTGHTNLWWRGKTQDGHTNLDRAKLVGEVLSKQGVDFTVWLGDDFRLCNAQQLAEFRQALDSFDHPVYKVVGNHDLDDNHGELIHPLQRDRYGALFGHDIYWYVDTAGYRLVFLAAESALGESYVSQAQLDFLAAALRSAPHPVLVFAHHVLPVREREFLNAMIGTGSKNTVKILDTIKASRKVIFWGWAHHHKQGNIPVQVRGMVEYAPHFATGYVDEEFVDSLETSVLTLENARLTLEVFDAFTSEKVAGYSFTLPDVTR